jgi:glutamate-5-semialdehyde dehydrogenase
MLSNYNKYFEHAVLAGRTSFTPAVINQVLKELAYSAIVLTDYL